MKKILSLLTLFFFLHSCTVHALKELPKERAYEIEQDNIVVIHQGEFSGILDKTDLFDGILTGNIKSYEKSIHFEELYKELHIHLNPDTKIDFYLNKSVSIPLVDIIKVEIYEHDTTKAAGNLVLGFPTVTTVSLAVVFSIAGIGFLMLANAGS